MKGIANFVVFLNYGSTFQKMWTPTCGQNCEATGTLWMRGMCEDGRFLGSP